MVERSKLPGCSCRQAGWQAWWEGARRLREVAPPPFASTHDKPAVCLLWYVESSCSPQLWYPAAPSASVTLSSFCVCFLTALISVFRFDQIHSYSHIILFLLVCSVLSVSVCPFKFIPPLSPPTPTSSACSSSTTPLPCC